MPKININYVNEINDESNDVREVHDSLALFLLAEVLACIPAELLSDWIDIKTVIQRVDCTVIMSAIVRCSNNNEIAVLVNEHVVKQIAMVINQVIPSLNQNFILEIMIAANGENSLDIRI